MFSPLPSYTKLRASGRWGVRVPGTEAKPGDVVTVYKKSGEANDEVLGALAHAFDDAMLFEIAKPAKTMGPPQVKPGVFEKDDEVYVVVANRAKTSVYAKRLVVLREAQGDRVNEEAEAVRFEYEYDKGAVFRLTDADRLSPERAKALCLKYGRCVRCGRGLEVKKSVEAGVGPVCAKAMGWNAALDREES